MIYIKQQNLLPCIVFFFSKAQVENLAREVNDVISLADNYEKSKIMTFVKKALQRLDEEDRELPQIKAL